VAHDRLHHTPFRISLVGATYLVGGCGGCYHSCGQDKDVQARRWLKAPSHLKSQGKTKDSLSGSMLEITGAGESLALSPICGQGCPLTLHAAD